MSYLYLILVTVLVTACSGGIKENRKDLRLDKEERGHPEPDIPVDDYRDTFSIEQYDSLLYYDIDNFETNFLKQNKAKRILDSICLVENTHYPTSIDTVFYYRDLSNSIFQFYQASFDGKFLLEYIKSSDLGLLNELCSSCSHIENVILTKNKEYKCYFITVYVEGYSLTIQLDEKGNLIVFEVEGLFV